MKKVSIIIPVYNMEDWVESGIKCITEQTYENLEIIIIDDGSKDGSYMKCLAEADKDRRIAVFGKNNEPKRRKILELRVVDAKSYQEIAKQEGISINTVKDHIKKAYAFLRKEVYQEVQDFILFLALTHSPKMLIKK